MPWFRLLFLSYAFFQSAYAKCTVLDQETKERAHCVFPFRDKYDNFNTNCTNLMDSEGYWCSTKNDENGTQITGHWGYCDAAESDCGLYPNKATEIIKAVELRNSENCPCTKLTQCKWSSDLLKIMKSLDRSHPNWIKGKETIKKRLCYNRKPRRVKCCSLMPNPRNTNFTLFNEACNQNQETSQFNQKEQSDKVNCSKLNSKPESGCWKPLESKVCS